MIRRGLKVYYTQSILHSKYTFPILSKVYHEYRPSLIAKELHISPQLVNYHMDNLIALGSIKKTGNRQGIRWDLTEKGLFILKQKAIGSVNPFKNNPKRIAVRLENVSIAFKIYGRIPDNERFHWTSMKNGVSKCTINKNEHTVELIKSEKQEQVGGEGSSVMLIHLSKQYCFNWTNKLVRLSYLALHYAKQASIQFGIEIADYGRPIKRPHFAFEYDLIAQFLATSNTAEIKTEEEGKAWIDSSNDIGELETNDPNYAYKYLKMPEIVMDIREDITSMQRMLLGYTSCWHPTLTHNN
ncbi:hypothetical protein BH18THE2_BH18THE2_27320 [soil metagenome]